MLVDLLLVFVDGSSTISKYWGLHDKAFQAKLMKYLFQDKLDCFIVLYQ